MISCTAFQLGAVSTGNLMCRRFLPVPSMIPVGSGRWAPTQSCRPAWCLMPAKAEDVELADTVSRVGPLDSFLEFDRQIQNHRSKPFEDRNESRRGSLDPAVNGFPGLDLFVFHGSLFLAGPRKSTLIKNRCCR